MARFVCDAVTSAIAQTASDLEIIVSDNASTDDTQERLKTFSDPRLRVFRNETNIGAIGNFNRCIELASAPWIKFLEADDYLRPDCVRRMLEIAERYPSVPLISAGRTLVNSVGSVVGHHCKPKTEVVPGKTLRRRVHYMHNEIGTPTDVMVKRELLLDVGGFDPEYGAYLNDFDLWIRCMDHCDVAFIGEPLVFVRRHEEQIGATGSRANLDIDVNMLMARKRWASPRALSRDWVQKHLFMCTLMESYFWRGAYRLKGGKTARGTSRLDFLKRLWSNMGLPAFAAGALYTALDTPFWLMRQMHRH
jgi:glycosyltransferase involved in cell wall biosynthesis